MRKLTLVLAASLLIAGQAMAQDEAGGEAKAGDGEAKSEGAVDSVQEVHNDVKEEGQEVASEAGVRGSSTSNYGTAGCGLGSLIFKPDSGFTQIFAATTNGTFGTQTFGITSGTSNCDDASGGDQSAKAFVQTNRAALSKDIARGRGETISSLAELAGCKDDARVGKSLRKNFKKIFPSAKVSDTQVSESVISVLQQDQSLSCSRVLGA